MSMVTIAKRAMRIVGSQSDPVILQTALEAIQEAANDINLRNSFDWTIQQADDIPLIENQRDYSLPQDLMGIKEVVLVKTSESPEEILPIGYIDWDQLQRIFYQHNTSHPIYWTARDIVTDRQVQVAPAPDAAAAADWKLRIYYRVGVDRPSTNDSTAVIEGPVMLGTILQRYAEYRLLSLYDRDNDFLIRQSYREYRDMVAALRGFENRSRPGTNQMRLQGVHQNATGRLGRHGGLRRWGR
jgi:hypothetical protein